ncbi:MAG: repair protein RecN [Acidobacteriota bacterium]|nr:repair protein RecN [Acidobacteriota bacterium]
MLDYLRVENFAVVEKVELGFTTGLNVMTGETGAGKSILIGAVTQFLNKKIPDSAIRGEDNKLVVEAMFSQGDEELVLRRETSRKKSQAFINGQMVPFSQLKDKAEVLFNIYGQNEHIFLLNPANHRLFLDGFCRNQDLLNRLSLAYQRLKEALAELDKLKRTADNAAEKLDFLGFQVSEIESLGLAQGDEAALEQRIKILSSAEEILSKAGSLVRVFHQDDNSLYNTIAENLKNLEYLKDIYPELAPMNDQLKQFCDLLPELSSTLTHIAGHVEYDEEELNKCNEKLFKLNRLKTKYKVNFEQLLQKLADLKKERNLLANMSFSLKEKQKEAEQRFQEYKELNLLLRENRQKKSGQLSALIEKELSKLEMKKAQFVVQVEEHDPNLTDIAEITEKGTDKIEFYFSSNPGQRPGSIREIASGGELSRLMLVLKSISDTDIYATYIFDEIDSGIGGKTAEFVGEKLKRIAERNQVICISHLPQIASFADTHFLITKEFKKGQTFSNVKELSDSERVGEIGRLMAGSVVTDDVLKAARDLLDKNRK